MSRPLPTWPFDLVTRVVLGLEIVALVLVWG